MSSAPEKATVRMPVGDLDIEFRPGTPEDVPLLLRFIQSMAEFERLEVSATEEALRESLFGQRPAAHTMLILANGAPVGYVIYFFTFSSMLGRRGLWLEDLFISPEFRGRGIGQAVMRRLAQIAIENQCARFEWIVLDWNERAIEFYKRLGADVLPDWRICRLESAGLERIVDGPPGGG